MSQKKIAIVICYFGPPPEWFSFFLRSCIYNHDIVWFFFTDQINIEEEHKNIVSVPFSLKQFNEIATKNLGFKIDIKDPYKLCDFKPAYGRIFKEYIWEFEFWGYSDIDIIYGDIRSFITNDMFMKNDIINPYRSFISGAFCLFRNTAYINSLFTQAHNVVQILQHPEHFGFDENIISSVNEQHNKQRRLYNYLLIFQYLIQILFTRPMDLLYYRELRYQFQWYYKKRNILRRRKLKDMTEVVWYLKRSGKIKLWNKEILYSDRYFNRKGKHKWEVIWDGGGLYEQQSQKYFLGFHFVESKCDPLFSVISSDRDQKMVISEKGINII